VEGPRLAERSTTALSPYLRFGCVSARTFYWRLQDDVYAARPKHALPPVSLHGQLLWREMFHLNAFAVPNFHQMEGNPLCRQVPWAEGAEADRRLAAWEAGATGFPWIDACMAQLREEGWLHHLARHAVACFLTRGDLWVSWERGRDVFDRLLVDSDPALNSANWMWLSCSAYFYQYFRCYSPVAFPKKYDKRGAYVRRWVPALAEMPDAYIYEPWKAPRAVQERAGCVVGRDYPLPIVDHREASQENMERMKAAYDAHKALKGAAAGGKGKVKGRMAPPRGSPAGKRAKT
jgi:cryptochrome